MAFGTHWEWRGFGVPAEGTLESLRELPQKFPTSQQVTDEYLYVPGCAINIKLRLGDLKFKRLLETRGRLECWLEDPRENHPFPLAPTLVSKLLKELGVECGSVPPAPCAREELLELLAETGAAIKVIPVVKERWQHNWQRLEGEETVIVELADITAPQRIVSVSLEHSEEEPLNAALDALGLPDGLQQLSYLDALKLWAEGKDVG